ncbi:leucine-rich repeat protein (LRR11) [Plasmodium ovale curtisi]|uniref:Leucine-rich repeat protein (LRR11) n=1 Tax=Plasmodium ovale curtisi TaxID=864141 RepID=A0A1A8VWA2_PLAOA|nr:leucine-rich repeat protein (LRR11) [Plasmodium ovale curtisi]
MDKTKRVGINNLFKSSNREDKGNGNKTSNGVTNGAKNGEIVRAEREKKKLNIWSLFSNIGEQVGESAGEGSSGRNRDHDAVDVFFTPRSAPPKKTERIEGGGNAGRGLFKNVQENNDIRREIESISSSFKRKNNILLTERTDDNVLSSILTTKRVKTNSEKIEQNVSPSYNSYLEFFHKTINQNQSEKNEKKKLLLEHLNNNSSYYKIKDDNVLSRMRKGKEGAVVIGGISDVDGVGEAHVSVQGAAGLNVEAHGPVKEGYKSAFLYTSIIKKKNICVPVNAINEKKKKEVVKKGNNFSKNDRFDIFSNLGDDLFRYILSNVKNKNVIFLNKRFCEYVRFLRLKLVYDESLKHSISPDSIIKTIYASSNIEVLDLTGCSHITSHHFNILCNSNNLKFSRTLKVLCLKNCNKISESSLKVLLHRCKKLTIVDIRNCYKIGHEGIYPLKFKTTLRKLYMGNLTSANVSNCHSNDTLRVLLGGAGGGIGSGNDIGINCHGQAKPEEHKEIQLDTPLTNLAYLEITHAKQLNDISHLYLLAKNLKSLNLKGCSIDETCSIIFKNFTNLLALNLSDTKISNEVITVVCDSSREMKVLDIANTLEIRNSTVLQIARSLRHLRKVKLSALQNVDNFCIREFLKNCMDLSAIDFSSCWKVNNSFCNTNGLEVASGRKLKDVGAYQCSIDRAVCEESLSRVGCSSIRVHIYNVKMEKFETKKNKQ